MLTAAGGALAAGGSLAALAHWSTAPATATVTTALGRPAVRWNRVSVAPGVAVHRYVVTRHAGPDTATACDMTAALTTWGGVPHGARVASS